MGGDSERECCIEESPSCRQVEATGRNIEEESHRLIVDLMGKSEVSIEPEEMKREESAKERGRMP